MFKKTSLQIKAIDLLIKTKAIHYMWFGGSRCFQGSQLVITSKGSKPIKDIKAGELVLSYDHKLGKYVFRPVLKNYKYLNNKETIEVTLKSGKKIVATSDHKFYTKGGCNSLRSILYYWDEHRMEKNPEFHKIRSFYQRGIKVNKLQEFRQDKDIKASFRRRWLSKNNVARQFRKIQDLESSQVGSFDLSRGGCRVGSKPYKWSKARQLCDKFRVGYKVRKHKESIQNWVNEAEEGSFEWDGEAKCRASQGNKTNRKRAREEIQQKTISRAIQCFRALHKRYSNKKKEHLAGLLDVSSIQSYRVVKRKYVYDLHIDGIHNYCLDVGYPCLVHNSGKTFLNVYIILTRALKYPNSRHLIARKTLKATKSAIIKDTIPKVIELCFPELKGNYKMNQSDWYMEFPNGSTIWFGGIGNVDEAEKILGNEYATIFLNETSELFYRAVLKVRTRLAQKIPGCRNYFLYDCNPPSRSHWSYKEFIENVSPMDEEQKLNPDDYKTMLLNPADNIENISDDYIKQLESMPERERNRFLLGLWQEEVEGAILGTELAKAEQEKRIGDYPHDPKYPVYTGWDIGHTDSTAIWFYQVIDRKIYFIDYYENCLEGLPHYIRVLEGKSKDSGYKYATDFYPHDGGNTEWAEGKTRKAIAIQKHKRKVIVLPRMGKQDQISLARQYMRMCYFGKGAKIGVMRLRNWRYEFDEKFGQFKDKEPLHDENSHGGDSFLYSIAGYNHKKSEIVFKTEEEKQEENLINHNKLVETWNKQSGKIMLDDL